MFAGSVTYKTILDTKGFQEGINDINGKVQTGGTKMKSIIGALGITKLISTGINMITNSLDSAIARVDTMNNFSKVMENLGISTTDSNKAINKLSEGLQGIPTRLDAGALAVQRFTSRNGDIQKSTDIFLALNNAILAGGASTQIQESAMEQLAQAYSKGKMDMMEWRTLQMAMPAQLKQVADTMGLDVDALGEMMRQGDETDKVMDQFINTIIDLNENGGKNIKSFAEQARNATGGIQTNITNMKTAISRGTAEIIKSVNAMLKKANINGIGDLVSRVGKKIETTLKSIAKLMTKLPLDKMISALKKLVPLIEMAVAGFVAYQVALKAISLINIARSIINTVSAFISLIPAITSAKDAMILLNTAFNANAIGIVISAVAALGTGIGLLVSHIKNQKEAMTETEQAIKDYDNSMKEANKARQEYLDAHMTEVQNYQDLSNELSNLVDENGRVKAGYEDRAQFIITTLNDALGTEIKMTDGVISNYDTLKNSIKELIEEKRAQTLLEAEEEKYNKARGERADLEEKYNNKVKETTKRLEEKHAKEQEIANTYGLTIEEVEKLTGSTYTYGSQLGLTIDQYSEVMEQLNEVNDTYETSRGELTKLKEKYEENELVIGNYETALQYLKDGNYEAVLKMYEDTTNYQGKTVEDTKKNYDAAILAQKLYLEDLKNKQNEYDEETYKNLVSSGEAKLKKLEEEQKQMTSTVKEGQKNTTDEYDKSTKEQVKKLDKKKEHKDKGKENTKSYADGIESEKGNVILKTTEIKNGAIDQLNSASWQATSAGQNTGQGFANGISQMASSVSSAARGIASLAIQSMKDEAGIHSPSRKTKKLGIYIDQGFAEGIEDGSEDVMNQVETLTDDVLDKMENAVNMETGKMSFNGTTGSVSQILSANAQFEGTIPIQLDLDGEKIYDNQQKISARKNLQYGGVK